MNVVIVGDEVAFPAGHAATGYVRLLARAIVSAGGSAHVVALDYTERTAPPRNTLASGTVDGVSFEYTTGTPILPTFPPAIALGRARSHARCFTDITARARSGSLDAMMYYGRYTTELLFCLAAARTAGVPLAAVLVEWRPSFTDQTPAQVLNDSLFNRALGRIDGALVISRDLADRVQPLLRPGAPCLRVPILADPTVWESVVPAHRPQPYAVLCADFDSYPDDAVSVVQSAAGLAPRPLELLFIGQASGRTRERLASAARALPPGIFLTLETSYIPVEALRGLYAGAAALIAPLPDTERSRARFPSKLADYLLSGRPVVSSSVGEVAAYLTHGVSAYLAAPGQPDGLAHALSLALGPTSQSVGAAGREVAREHFDYRRQGPRVLKFLHGLPRRRSP